MNGKVPQIKDPLFGGDQFFIRRVVIQYHLFHRTTDAWIFKGLVLVCFLGIGKKKLTDIGLFVWFSSGLDSLVSLDFGLVFSFLQDIGLIDIVPINFWYKRTPFTHLSQLEQYPIF